MNSQLFKRPRLPLALLGLVALLVASARALPQPSPGDTLRLPTAGALTMRRTATPLDSPITPHAAFEQLQARADGALSVHWNATTGIPDFLTGADPATRLPYTPTAAERGPPEAIARGFLDQNRALFGIRSAASELRLLRVEPDAQLDFKHVRLGQIYHGIPVFGKQLIVHLDARERIVAVNGQFAPGVDVPTRPAIDAREAERRRTRQKSHGQKIRMIETKRHRAKHKAKRGRVTDW